VPLNERTDYLQVTKDALDAQDQNSVYLDPTGAPTRWPTRELDDSESLGFSNQVEESGLGAGPIAGIAVGIVLLAAGAVLFVKSRELNAPPPTYRKKGGKVANPAYNPNSRTL
jgi:hypothetical protein